MLIGRPVVWALAVGGEAGVSRLLELLRDEIELALALLGCPRPTRSGPSTYCPQPPPVNPAKSGRFV